MQILIAEDDLTSRTILTAVLKKSGYEVISTRDGEEAWDTLQQPDAPRLAILDWMMPRLDGLTVCQRIRAVETEQPPYIIMLTTRNESNDIVKALLAGADDYLVKPFDPEELHARVEVGRRMIYLQDRLADKVLELREALEQVKTLQGILPICSYCKKIRDDRNYWQQVEEYVASRSEARFSHSICPQCMLKHFPDFAKEITEDDPDDDLV
jgi:DNA-binding response OmpR family regulator